MVLKRSKLKKSQFWFGNIKARLRSGYYDKMCSLHVYRSRPNFPAWITSSFMHEARRRPGEKSPQGTLASSVQSCVQSNLSFDSSAFLVGTMGAHSILPKCHGLPFFVPKFHTTKKYYPLKSLDSPFVESPETHRLFFLSVTLLLIILTAREPVAELLAFPDFITSPDCPFLWRLMVVICEHSGKRIFHYDSYM